MLESVDAALARLYPTQTWGEVDDMIGDALPRDEIAQLADELATELRAAAFVRTGGDDEPCDYIYILCLGRPPCIVQVRDHGVPPPDEWMSNGMDMRSETRIEELYLRLVISQRTRMAAVQQVAITVAGCETTDGGYARDRAWLVSEQPRAGVYDAPLLSRMQKLVAVLPAYDLLHIDFGEIAHSPPGFHAGTWPSLFAGKPAIANYLFYPQPTTMTSTTLVEPYR